MSDDPALTEPLAALFERNDQRPAERKGPKRQPHSALKKRCRDALARWSGAKGVLIPIQNIRVETGNGAFMTGRVGAGDDIWLYAGRAFSLEYKHGHDTQRDSQKRFQQRWEAAGGIYLVVRSPEQLIEAVEATLRGEGRWNARCIR